ncbi:chemotaxis protein CheW [Pelagicoccus mobilis]|uniref:Purine-binding chemotaxis protein CheW n=1 Tax=Pelagicoccus mobilis TaxID=415221 RepID=A0A934S3L1_9BACT|nr:chemotaxis protein CheW [Pelagicoccus mobilis]MBK1879162.1 purine-binding chemotaxis protein CheW [Pelagicoccus mobilis]
MDTSHTQAVSSTTESDSTVKFLTFKLASESYGIEALKIREIIHIQEVTKIPRMPAYIKGVINLRGKVIPVMDLRVKLEVPASEVHDRTCVIVIELAGSNSLFGLMVDGVEEVVNIPHDAIEPFPELGSSEGNQCSLGIAKVGNGIKTLLNIEEIVTEDRDLQLPIS